MSPYKLAQQFVQHFKALAVDGLSADDVLQFCSAHGLQVPAILLTEELEEQFGPRDEVFRTQLLTGRHPRRTVAFQAVRDWKRQASQSAD